MFHVHLVFCGRTGLGPWVEEAPSPSSSPRTAVHVAVVCGVPCKIACAGVLLRKTKLYTWQVWTMSILHPDSIRLKGPFCFVWFAATPGKIGQRQPGQLRWIAISPFLFLELCVVSSKDQNYLIYRSKKNKFFFLIKLFGWHYQNTGSIEVVMGLGTSIKSPLPKIWPICP